MDGQSCHYTPAYTLCIIIPPHTRSVLGGHLGKGVSYLSACHRAVGRQYSVGRSVANLSRTTSSVVWPIIMKFGIMYCLGVSDARHIFRQWQKECSVVTAHLGKMGEKSFACTQFLSSFINSHEIWQRCLHWSVDVHRHNVRHDRKSVAMVTAYYGKNGGKPLRRELIPQFFTNSHDIWH